MNSMTSLYIRLLEQSRGQTAIEYVLILAVISILAFGSLTSVETTVHGLISDFLALF